MAKKDNYEKYIKILLSHNKKASFAYELGDTYEAGLVLLGGEVKSLRRHKANITDTHIAACSDGQDSGLYIFNLHIAAYDNADKFSILQNKRPRKLLLHRKEIDKLRGLSQVKGYSIIPIKLYFNQKNLVKILFAIGKGKKEHDKRQAIQEREWQRDKGRLLKQERQ
jgi:SsrA-binding protein